MQREFKRQTEYNLLNSNIFPSWEVEGSAAITRQFFSSDNFL